MYQISQKKIIIFAPDFKPLTGGVAEYTYHLARELNKLNKLEYLITTVHQQQKYEFTVVALNQQKHDRHVGKRLGDANVLGRKINSVIYFGKLYLFTLASFVKILLASQNTLLLITYTENIYSKIIIKLCHLFKIEYGVCLHGLDIVKMSLEKRNYLKGICKKAIAIIFNSQATKQLFESLSFQIQNNSYILYPGINPRDCNRLATMSIEQIEARFNVELQNKTIILSVARHVKRKGLDIGIKAAALLAKEYNNFIYLIAGDGEESQNYHNLIAEYNLADKVILTGRITETEKFSLLNFSSIFVMPNHQLKNTDFEGFGISFIEASYFENAIIGGRSGGAVEAVKDNVSGFLIDPEREYAEQEVSIILQKLKRKLLKIFPQVKQYIINNFINQKLIAEFASKLNNLFKSSTARFESQTNAITAKRLKGL